MTAPTRRTVVMLLSALLALSLAGSPVAVAHAFPDRLPLPDGFQPEGIAIGRGPTAYTGSLADGDIYRVDLRTGRGAVLSEGPGTPSVGMKLDRCGRLFVAGGPAGDARVVDTRTGDVLASYALAEAPTFVNDVVLTRHAAWFTDSMRAVLHRVPLGKRLATQSAVTDVPLGGEWQQVPDAFNANGIARTPDGRALLVVQSVTGFLFRVDRATGDATRVDLGSTLLINGDGLLVEGRRLYVVLNQLNRIAVLRLKRDGSEGRLKRFIDSTELDVPTTVARFGRSLYLPNARFTTPPTPTTDYWITRVDR